MGYIHDLTEPFTPPNFCRARPGPVRTPQALAPITGSLILQWRPPAGSRVAFYRIERTADGHAYETLAEVFGQRFCLRDAPLREAWFYRVTAVNARGAGRAKCVWFFQRVGNRRSRLMFVPVMHNVCISICQLVSI
jgi:hypothetical protein